MAGLHLGLTLAGLTDIQVIGVVVNDKLRLDHRSITSLARRAARLLQDRGAKLPSIDLPAERLTLLRDWLGPGYGHPTSQGTLALKLARESEHLDLEPVYTAKAMAALLDLPAHQRAAVARTGVPCCTTVPPALLRQGGCPLPTLAITDLHVVMCCVLCPITGAQCWAAMSRRESNPLRCPPRASRDRTLPADLGLVHASATTTCSTSAR